MNPKKVKLFTLGCRLNFFESDGIFSALRTNGYTLANQEDGDAGVVIINTCTVTAKADVKNRNIIRKAIATNPGSQVWVTGCYAQTDREILAKIPGVTGIAGNDEKGTLAARIMAQDLFQKSSDRFSYSNVLPAGHTRAYLKIQDGCDRKCSYCKIPQARGKGTSRGKQDILEQVKFLQDNGIGELILTGVNIGWYKDSSGKKSLLPLIESILKILDYSRLRISSIEPPDVGTELAELLQHPRFCNYLHIPLQSGSKEILKRMRRSYFPETFYSRIVKVKEKNPEIFIGTDVIAGFPGESQKDFNDTMQLVKDCGIAKIHAFPWSERNGTEAEKFNDKVPMSERKERVKMLNELSDKLYFKYSSGRIGKIHQGILENDGTIVTDNYLKIKLENKNTSFATTGQFMDIIPVRHADGNLLGVYHNASISEKNLISS